MCVCATCNQDVGSGGGQLRAAAALAREGGLAEEEADALEALADVAIMPCRDDHHFTREKKIPCPTVLRRHKGLEGDRLVE